MKQRNRKRFDPAFKARVALARPCAGRAGLLRAPVPRCSQLPSAQQAARRGFLHVGAWICCTHGARRERAVPVGMLPVREVRAVLLRTPGPRCCQGLGPGTELRNAKQVAEPGARAWRGGAGACAQGARPVLRASYYL